MGPEATVLFLQHLVELTPAERDQDHIPVIALNDPTVPDRTAFLKGHGPSPVPKLVEGARALRSLAAELIAIPCNTAHLFWTEIARSVDIPVLHIVDETVRRIQESGNQGPIGILGTTSTIASGLYQRTLETAGVAPLTLAEPSAAGIQDLIYSIKAGMPLAPLRERLARSIAELHRSGAKGVILGCTELGLIPNLPDLLPCFDSLRILAEATVEQALL